MSRMEGVQGEALVARYLRQHGCKVVAHSYHSRFGEIDLIAWDGAILCFVEVKTRTNVDKALPREYVTPQKQNKLRKPLCCIWRKIGWIAVPASMWRRSTLSTALQKPT